MGHTQSIRGWLRFLAAIGVRALSADDVASAITWVLSAPERVDVTALEILPAEQAMGGGMLKRSER